MSVKLRITLWFTLMVLLLSAMVLVFVFVVNGSAITPEPSERLVKLVMRNARRVEYDNGRFEWEDLKFYKQGISCTFYNGEGKMLKGSVIDELDMEMDEIPLESDILRSIDTAKGKYYLYDTYVDMDVAGFWIRGIVPADSSSGLMRVIIILTCTLLPALALLTLGGGWLIVSCSMRPIDRIIKAANSISDGDDLSARIGITWGPKEMRQLSRAFDRMFERLDRAFAAERQFASDASHELRTPITVILAQCSRARRKDSTPEDYQKSIAVIEEQAGNMSELVQELLGLTRLQRGADRYEMKVSDMSGFVLACCEDFTPADSRGISLETDVAEGVSARYNPGLMARVIQNLLQNAYKYGRENGHIKLSLRSEKGKAVLRVSDDGAGISPEDLPHIWQRFWQADPSRHHDDGSSGLGLAMVKEIAEFHGGTASAESVPGRGCTFTVSI